MIVICHCHSCGKVLNVYSENINTFALPPGWTTYTIESDYSPDYIQILPLCSDCSIIKDIIE